MWIAIATVKGIREIEATYGPFDSYETGITFLRACQDPKSKTYYNPAEYTVTVSKLRKPTK